MTVKYVSVITVLILLCVIFHISSTHQNRLGRVENHLRECTILTNRIQSQNREIKKVLLERTASFQNCDEKYIKLTHACRNMQAECHKVIHKAYNIIKHRQNCKFAQRFITRKHL